MVGDPQLGPAPDLGVRRAVAPQPLREPVALHREGATLVVAPFGLLDATTVTRLREIVETRRTLYPAILIDLRELDSLSSSGLTALASWTAETPWPPTISAHRDPRLLAELTHAGLTGTVPLTEA